jgi:hypothetical protein
MVAILFHGENRRSRRRSTGSRQLRWCCAY